MVQFLISKDIVRTIKRTTLIWYVSGLPNYVIRDGSVLETSHRYLLNKVITTIILALNLYTVLEDITGTGILRFTTTIAYVTILLKNSTTLVYFEINIYKIPRLLVSFVKTEAKITEATEKRRTVKGRVSLIFIIIYYGLVSVSLGITIAHVVLHKVPLMRVLNIGTILVVDVSVAVALTSFLVGLDARFGLILEEIQQYNDNKKAKNTRSESVVTLLKVLQEHGYDVIGTFNIAILVKVLNNFCIVMSSLVLLISYTLHGTHFLELMYLMHIVWLATETAFCLTCLCYIDNAAKKIDEVLSAYQDREAIVGIDEFSYKQGDLLHLHVVINNPPYMVCGLFPLDWSSMFTLVTATATYIVYLVQFGMLQDNTGKVCS